MQPSPEAREWGRRQAARAPRWSEEKWNRVAVILGVRFTKADQSRDPDVQPRRDAA